MHVQFDSRNVASTSQVRSSEGSSKEIHSWRSSGDTAPKTTACRYRCPVVNDALVRELRMVLGADRVRTGPTELVLYGRDASNMNGQTSVVCLPTSAAEVQMCVKAAVTYGVPFVARGSGTGLAGGAVPLD